MRDLDCKQVAPKEEGAKHRYSFHYAESYRERGWSVIPLIGKHPAVLSWNEYRERLPSWEELHAWFKSPDTNFNIGIVTGTLSGLVVVDCDTPEDALHWRQTFPATSLVVTTGRGGSHFYYQAPKAEVRNRAKLFGRAIDLRGEGGYVCAPPSMHPQTGTLYSWENERTYSRDEVPYFDPNWLPVKSQGTSEAGPVSSEQVAALPIAGKSIRRRIQGVIRYLAEHAHEPDRSKRDFGAVLLLLRLGCSSAEIEALVSGHSKFKGNTAYLKLTVQNALREFLKETS